MSATPEFSPSELIQAWLDGEATPEQQAQLGEWLKLDRANVQLFVREAHMHRALREMSLAKAGLPAHESSGTAKKVDLSPAAQKRSSKLWIGLALAACALLAVGIFFQTQHRPRETVTVKPPVTPPVTPPVAHPVLATIAEAGAEVRVRRGEKSLSAAAGFELQALDSVTVAENGSAVIKYPDGSALTLKAQTEIELEPKKAAQIPDGAGKVVQLTRGLIEVSAAKQPAEHPMALATEHAVAVVIGTKFTLFADSDSTRLDVEEGRVKFSRNNSPLSLVVAANGFALVDGNAMTSDNASPDVSDESQRIVDDFENARLRWAHADVSAPMDFDLSTEKAHSGKQSLRAEYKPTPRDVTTYTEILHPITIEKSDRVLRFYMFVEACDPKSNWNVQLRLRDRSCWIIGDGKFAALKRGWNRIEIDIQHKPIQRAYGNTSYVPTEAEGLLFSACTASATFYLDDFTLAGRH
jgi:ferric-dicitrate binding protein FerR (iron transport regulator)